MRTYSIILLVFAVLFTAQAQDVITLKNGEEIKAKVTEISTSEIKYKRFENQDGPTIVIAKSDVFIISYEGGRREVINVISNNEQPNATVNANPTPNTNPLEIPSPASEERFRHVGIYLDPLGLVFAGPKLGFEVNLSRHLSLDIYGRAPMLGLLTDYFIYQESGLSGIKGFAAGINARYIFGEGKGFYTGLTTEYMKVEFYSPRFTYFEFKDLIAGINFGYKLRLSSAFYLRAGGFIGVDREFEYESTTFYGLLEGCIGIAF